MSLEFHVKKCSIQFCIWSSRIDVSHCKSARSMQKVSHVQSWIYRNVQTIRPNILGANVCISGVGVVLYFYSMISICDFAD